MNDAESKIKQQVIDKIKSSTNILVTISRDPSVDDITALIGLNVMLNKMDKHATAIFSGEIPTAISFLDPERSIENTADSLRDFIISLDKEKADHLRYKIDGDMVKIFITPYRTTISSSDLEFSQGELNIELVLALGVESKQNLDSVLTSQNGAFNDAMIITFSDGARNSELGDIDWNDKNASCLSEMVASLSESFKPENEKTILDKQISTALLTGIISATDRFSNIQTTAKSMTIAAQLIATGADPQLISAKLQEAHEVSQLEPQSEIDDAEMLPIVEDVEMLDAPVELEFVPTSTLPPEDATSLVIDHSDSFLNANQATEEMSTLSHQEDLTTLNGEEPGIDKSSEQTATNEQSTLPSATDFQMQYEQSPAPNYENTQSETNISTVATETLSPQSSGDAPETSQSTLSPEDMIQEAISSLPSNLAVEPSFGGTLNATTEQASEDSRKELESVRNKKTLSHAYIESDTPESQANAQMDGLITPSSDGKTVDIFNQSPNLSSAENSTPPEQHFDSIPTIQPPTLTELPPEPPKIDISSIMPPSIIPAPEVPFAPIPQPAITVPSSIPGPSNPAENDPSAFRIPGQ